MEIIRLKGRKYIPPFEKDGRVFGKVYVYNAELKGGKNRHYNPRKDSLY